MSSALPRTATTLRAGAAAAALALALTGCGAGFEAVTYQERSNADAANAAVGAVAVRGAAVEAGREGVHEAGGDAEVRLTLVNDGGEDDRLVGASSEDAGSVEILLEGEEVDDVDLPRLGTTGGLVTLRLVGLAEDLRSGSAVDLTLQFERNGEVSLVVPVATTGEYDEEREKSDNFHVPGEHEEGEH